ncbi:MAG: hypothetical protein ABI882_11395, partial [Acidobacteriota bacterium]
MRANGLVRAGYVRGMLAALGKHPSLAAKGRKTEVRSSRLLSAQSGRRDLPTKGSLASIRLMIKNPDVIDIKMDNRPENA